MEENILDNKIEIFALGIDFSNDFSQVSYMGANYNEPTSLSTIKGDKRYLIPTVLYKKRQINVWCVGDEANQRSYDDDDDSQTLRDILKMEADYTTEIEGTSYSRSDIFDIYFQEVVGLARKILNAGMIHEVVITLAQPDKSIIDSIYASMCKLGFERERIRVLSHSEAFVYYTLNQNKEVWTNDVALFDFNQDHFIYKRLNIIKNKNPNIINVIENDYSRFITYDMLAIDATKKKADLKFLEIITEEFRKHITSAVFLTGVGFYEDWTSKSLKELCSRRKVFKGYNLFVKGACYAAWKKYKSAKGFGSIFQCEGRTRCNIGLLIDHKGKNIVMLLSKAGTNWYEAGAKVECIVDNLDSVQLELNPVISNISRTAIIGLESLPKRPNKTTRIQISIAYTSCNVCNIEIKDLGFGEFYPPSDVIIRETLDIDSILL